MQDVVAADQRVPHRFDVRHLALGPVKDASEGVLQHIRGALEVFHELILVLLAAEDHAIQGLDGHFGPLGDIGEVPLLVLAERADYLLLEAHRLRLAGHEGHYLALDVLVVEKHLLQELVKGGQLGVGLDPANVRRILHDVIVGHIEGLLVLGQNATWRLLGYIFEQLLDVGDL